MADLPAMSSSNPFRRAQPTDRIESSAALASHEARPPLDLGIYNHDP
jgi:hypothetical protein